MWKAAKDSHCNLQGKKDKSKSGDAVPGMDDTEATEDETSDNDMCFLHENSAMQLRDTGSVGDVSSFGDESVDGEVSSSSSNDSYAAGGKKRARGNGDGDALAAAQLLSQTIASYFDKKKEIPQDSGLKYEGNWKQIEQMYKHLHEDTIIDLNFQFMAITHKAVVAARKSK